MDFNSKNFRYVTESFENVIRRAEAGHRVYLRALSREKPMDRPANIKDDFPGIASDFHLPNQMDSIQDGIFSSVLRVSGRVNMWLHYDVCSIVYRTRYEEAVCRLICYSRSWRTCMPKL